MITATIKVEGDPERLYRSMQSETFENDRTKYTITKDADGITFTIEAQDAVAFRATINAITSLLTIYEKVEND